MILRIFERVGNTNIQNKVVRVVRVHNRNIPGGITVDTLTEAGSMIVALGASNPSETGAPSADGQVWTSDLAEPLKGRWLAVAGGGGSLRLTNKSGSNLTAGTVVVLDKTNDTAFNTTTFLRDRRVVGVLEEDINNNEEGSVAVAGKIVTVNVQGNVARGMWLVASSTAGRAAQDTTIRPNVGGIGIALTEYSGGGAGTVLAVVDVDLYSAFLEIEYLGTAATGTANSTSVNASHTLLAGSNRIAFALVACSVGQTVSGVTYGGVAMTRLGTGVAGANQRMELYYLLDASMPANGVKTATATLSGTAQCTISVWTIHTAKQAAPAAPATNFSASAAALSANVTINIDGSFSITGVFSAANTTFSHGTGQVEISDHQNTSLGTLSASYERHTATGTQPQESTAGTTNHMLFMATVVEPV